jgi:hypothetical protein
MQADTQNYSLATGNNTVSDEQVPSVSIDAQNTLTSDNVR